MTTPIEYSELNRYTARIDALRVSFNVRSTRVSFALVARWSSFVIRREGDGRPRARRRTLARDRALRVVRDERDDEVRRVRTKTKTKTKQNQRLQRPMSALGELSRATQRALARVVQGKARRGVFAGKHIGFGNTISDKGGNKCV